MIQCPECSQKLSKSAVTCTSCGRRMRSGDWIRVFLAIATVIAVMLVTMTFMGCGAF